MKVAYINNQGDGQNVQKVTMDEEVAELLLADGETVRTNLAIFVESAESMPKFVLKEMATELASEVV